MRNRMLTGRSHKRDFHVEAQNVSLSNVLTWT